MTVIQSIPYALFCMAVVFLVLIILSLIIKIFSLIIDSFAKQSNNKQKSIDSTNNTEIDNGPELSCGELKLYNVDESTAAMVMAIVSDESGIPLDQLCFKSIKAKQ